MAMFAPNAVAVMDTGFPTDDTSVPNAASDLGDGRNCAAQDPYAADAVVSGVQFCVPGQAGHLSRSTGGNAWNDL